MRVLHLRVCTKAQGNRERGCGAAVCRPSWSSLRHLGHGKGRGQFLPSPRSLSHRDLRASGSKGPSQRNQWVINLIGEAGSSDRGRGGNRNPSFLLLRTPALNLAPPPASEFCPSLLSFHHEVKGVKISLFLPVFPGSLNSWGLLIILKWRAFPGSLPPGAAPPPPASFSLLGPWRKARYIHLDLCKVDQGHKGNNKTQFTKKGREQKGRVKGRKENVMGIKSNKMN